MCSPSVSGLSDYLFSQEGNTRSFNVGAASRVMAWQDCRGLSALESFPGLLCRGNIYLFIHEFMTIILGLTSDPFPPLVFLHRRRKVTPEKVKSFTHGLCGHSCLNFRLAAAARAGAVLRYPSLLVVLVPCEVGSSCASCCRWKGISIPGGSAVCGWLVGLSMALFFLRCIQEQKRSGQEMLGV